MAYGKAPLANLIEKILDKVQAVALVLDAWVDHWRRILRAVGHRRRRKAHDKPLAALCLLVAKGIACTDAEGALLVQVA